MMLTKETSGDVVKIEGTTNVEDATLRSGAQADWNHGSCTFIAISYTQVYVGLIRAKNLKSIIGEGANITAAGCSLWAYSEDASTDNIGIHPLFKPWTEGSSCESDAAGCTWNDWDSDTYEWTTEGCLCANDDGVDNSYDNGDCNAADRRDRKSTAMDTEDCDGTPSWHYFAIDTAIANAWYNETKNEEGIAIVASEGYHVYYRSTEWTTPSERPFFVFTYTVEADSLIQTVLHVDSTCSTFRVRDSVATLYSATVDSVILWASATNDLSGADRMDIFTGGNVDTLEATELNEDDVYYFWCVAWDLYDGTDYADTTAVDSVVVPVCPSGDSEKGKFRRLLKWWGFNGENKNEVTDGWWPWKYNSEKGVYYEGDENEIRPNPWTDDYFLADYWPG